MPSDHPLAGVLEAGDRISHVDGEEFRGAMRKKGCYRMVSQRVELRWESFTTEREKMDPVAVEKYLGEASTIRVRRSSTFQLLHDPQRRLLTQALSASYFLMYGKEVQAVEGHGDDDDDDDDDDGSDCAEGGNDYAEENRLSIGGGVRLPAFVKLLGQMPPPPWPMAPSGQQHGAPLCDVWSATVPSLISPLRAVLDLSLIHI